MDVQQDRPVSATWQQVFPDAEIAKRVILCLHTAKSDSQRQESNRPVSQLLSLVAVEEGAVASRYDFEGKREAVCKDCGKNPSGEGHSQRCRGYWLELRRVQPIEFNPAGRPAGLYAHPAVEMPGMDDLQRDLLAIVAARAS